MRVQVKASWQIPKNYFFLMEVQVKAWQIPQKTILLKN